MAETLEAAHCADLHAIASVLALHFECGQDFERAVHFSDVAGEKSYREGAYREAAAHFRRGIRLFQQLQQVPTRDAAEARLRDGSTPTLDLFQAKMGLGTARVEISPNSACSQRPLRYRVV
jgi:hypothetical protein